LYDERASKSLYVETIKAICLI